MKIPRRQIVLCGTALFAGASQPKTKVRFKIPGGACDCHTHVFAPQYPFAEKRSYTPEPAVPGEMSRLHKSLGIDRVVIVTPSVYGTDNRATAYGLKALGLERARGVAVVGPSEDLAALDRQGFRGIRLNFQSGAITTDRFRQAVAQVTPLGGWHIQINTGLAAIVAMERELTASPLPVVLDHVCGAVPALGVHQSGFDALLRLVATGHVYVKLTHRFLSTAKDPKECAPIVRTLVEARPDRMLWGTDWPHPDSSQRRTGTEVSPLVSMDDGAMLNHFASFVPDAAVLRRILVENPAQLYRF